MATLSRPPLVFSPQRKAWVASPDVYPNLLSNTLKPAAPTYALPLSAGRMTESAPRRDRNPKVDAYPNVTLTTLQLDTTNVPIVQLSGDVPIRRQRLSNDVYPNLLTTTLGAPPPAFALPLSALRLDASAPPPKRPVYAQQLEVRAVWRDPVPVFMRMDASAPPPKAPVSVQAFPNLSITTLAPLPAFALPLAALRLDQSAPPPKIAVRIDGNVPRPVWLDPVPRVQSLSDSAPPPKRPVQVDVYPNLLATTLKPVVPWPLPLSAQRIDWSHPQMKRVVRIEHLDYRPFALGVPPTQTEFDVIVPYLIEDSLSAALMRIASIYCVANVIGSTGSVTAQDPAAFTRVRRGTTITITLGGSVHTSGQGNSRARPPYGAPDAIPPFPKRRRH